MTSYPKIGIRPIIDGRLGGVRESLEETTMKMAQNVAALYEKELRYPDGSPVQCVIADSCIGGVYEAAQCAQKFEAKQCLCFSFRNALLVLRQRNDGHESCAAKSNLGLQWYGASRRCLSRSNISRAQPNGFARLWYLWKRRAGFRR